MAKLFTLNGETLLNTPLVPTRFVVNKLLPQGLHILAGPPKAGKSQLSLWLCLQVSKGQQVWQFASQCAGVLYLCLEDSFSRIQERLLDITDDAPDNLYFATVSDSIGNGLEKQIEDFITEQSSINLIVIDTLQKVRSLSVNSNPYASDYRDIGILKQLADRYRIAILLIHNLRKMNDDDPVNMISGTTGISGATDCIYILKKDKRSSNKAVLHCTGRDIEYSELQLEFDKEAHIWNMISDSTGEQPEQADQIILFLSAHMESELSFTGTATELASVIEEQCGISIRPNVLIKKIVRNRIQLAESGITFELKRTHDRKEISLRYECVGCVGYDGKNDKEPVSELSTQPSQPMREALEQSTLLRA